MFNTNYKSVCQYVKILLAVALAALIIEKHRH